MKKLTKAFKVFFIGIGLSTTVLVGGAFTGGAGYFEISKNLDIFTTLFRELNMYYVDDTEPGKLMKTAIDAMLKSLDPYTVYIPESEIEDFNFQRTGQYGGIGALIRKKDNYVIISEPYLGFPAQKSGLNAGDILLEIDGKSVEGKNTSQVSEVLKGEPGTLVKVKVKHPITGDEREVDIERKEIQVATIPYYGMVDEEVGYIRLRSFTETATKDVKAAFLDLKENQGMKKLVLDLRGNPGGLLREAINMVNLFVPKGTEVVSTKGKVKEWDKTYYTLNQPIDTEMPVTVLINSGSASASEIVAGTLQDLDRAIVVGQRSFGKGLVQQPRKLSYGAQLKVTIAKYYTPSGRCIQAIDYASRKDDGSISKLPDSLRTAFTTANGRTVYDGGGIDPDIEVKQKNAPDILISLVSNSLIFDYATKYAHEHESIPDASKFVLKDEDFEDMRQFLSDKHYTYETESEHALEKFKNISEEENYFEGVDETFEELKEALLANKSDDLGRYKKDILSYTQSEIASRYYYLEGRISNSLIDDPDVEAALRVLKDSEEFASVLKP